MKKLFLVLCLAAVGAIPALAQEDDVDGIPADFTEYLKTTRPGLDPAGEHDIFNLKNPTDPDERHEYTRAMLHIVAEYVHQLEMGATISKLFDQYSRQQQGNWPTFKVLHAQLLRMHPGAKPNITGAQRILREVREAAPDYALPRYMLAEYEFARFAGMSGQASPSDVLELLDEALEIRPEFLRARMMKAQVYLMAKPPRRNDVREMMKPWFEGDKIPSEPDDFEDVLRLYSEANPRASLIERVDLLIESDGLPEMHVLRAHMLVTSLHLRDVENDAASVATIDAAIERLEKVTELAKPGSYPSIAVSAHNTLAFCWRAKAMELHESGSDDNASVDAYHEAAVDAHRRAAEIERDHMPKALRGAMAREYTAFLSRNLHRHEEALEWLVDYLENTDLTSAQRRVTIIHRQAILNRLNPSEDGLIEMYKLHVANDDMVRLGTSLGLAREDVIRRDQHFRREGSLAFFIEQIGNRDRLITQYASFLAADTARQIGHDAIRRAGDAIADRYEEEIELNSNDQAELQQSLSRIVRDQCGPRAQERVVRHFAQLLEDSPGVGRMNMITIFDLWSDDAFLESLRDNAPDDPDFSHRSSPERAAGWLRELADGLARHSELVDAEWTLVDAFEAINDKDSELYLASHATDEVAREGLTGELEDALGVLRDRFTKVEVTDIQRQPDEKVIRAEITVEAPNSDDPVELTVDLTRTDKGWKLTRGLAGQLDAALPDSDGIDDE